MNIMQLNKVTSCGLRVASGVLLACLLALSGLTSCSPKDSPKVGNPDADKQSYGAVTSDDSDLLLRARFSGTAVLLAGTRATYLTNIVALPETAALGKRLVERMAALPIRLLTPGSTNFILATNLAPVFSNLLQQGFAVELRGDSNGVYSMILAAPNAAMVPAQLQGALGSNVSDRSSIYSTNGWTTWVVGARTNHQPPTINHQLVPPTVLAVDMASTLLPNPVRRGVYGGFKKLSFTAAPAEYGFEVRGTATYDKDLPALSGPVTVPTNLVTEPVASFSMVRNPAAWLEPDSPIRNFLPQPVPDIAWFWGGQSPYQIFFAVPLSETNQFETTLGARLATNLTQLAQATGSGPVTPETNRMGFHWQGIPYVGPRVGVKPSNAGHYLVAEVFPGVEFGPSLTPALLDKTEGTTSTLIFDWEFTAARVDTWFRVGQLALFMGGRHQLGDQTASTKWLQALTKNLVGGGNTFTEITQTGPRELKLNRLAPVALSSLELFWLANWLESEKFPDANFLVPASSPFATEEQAK
jgi:hypothetical protein